MNVPKLRFKGFEGEWEDHQLKKILSLLKDGTHGTHKDVSEGPYLLSAKNIVNGEIKISENDRKISNEEYNSIYKSYTLKQGDVLLSVVGTIGRTAIVHDESFIAFQRSVAILRGEKVTSKYLLYLVQSESFQHQLKVKQVVSAQPGIYLGDLGKIKVKIPCIEEQKRIGIFFEKLDQKIQLQQEKIDLLQKQKKGFLQKMFPKAGETQPELRFEGFTGEWMKKSMDEIAPLRGGYAFKSKEFQRSGIPIVRISNILSNGEVGGDFVYYKEQQSDQNYILPHSSVVLAMSGATTGKVAVINNLTEQKVYQNQRVGYFVPTTKVNYDFVTILVETNLFINQLKKVLVAGAQPNVSTKEVNNFKFRVPKVKEEQIKIGLFFKAMDNKISSQEQKLYFLQQQKVGFLQQMFV
ncbi:restriction endonuclease subunit S [Savagea faecisuis]|uniref:Restriction endonuclease subunit S n=1 Tax=Savagea faecisuis TaxID=1274803 RepID=A0ABW3GV15_9BACL